jgi:hypothetical protein
VGPAADIRWLVPWYLLDAESASATERELARELGRDHQLYGKRVRAVARRQDCDDVLFELPDSGCCAVVHLTWTKSPPERNPSWPGTAVYASLAEWAATGMVEDHHDFVT